MARDLLIATSNRKKKSELQEILAGYDINVVSLDELEGMPDIDEDGATFADNALKKARTMAKISGMLTLADDSGLMVDALGGAPGIYSARFAGPDCNDADNNAKLLKLLGKVPKTERTARFVCVIAMAIPGSIAETAQGICEGSIIETPRGQKGFGYDPLFIPAGYTQTFAELGEGMKNQISHRGRALQAAKPLLRRLLNMEG